MSAGPQTDPPDDAPAWTRRPVGLSRAVTAELVERIVSGHYPVGTTLPTEPALCDTFSVSRTVIREAVKMLQEKGLVRVRQGSGTLITDPDSWNLLDEQVLAASITSGRKSGILDDLVITRRLLEADMAHLAATTISGDDLERLRELVERMDTLVDDWPSYIPYDKEFHDVIMLASGNRLARGVVRSLESQAAHAARYVGSPRRGDVVESNAGHREILDSLAAGDAPGAAAAMNRHITEGWLKRRKSKTGTNRLSRDT